MHTEHMCTWPLQWLQDSRRTGENGQTTLSHTQGAVSAEFFGGKAQAQGSIHVHPGQCLFSDSGASGQAWWEPLIWLQESLWAAFSTLPTTHAIVNTSPLRVWQGVALPSLWSP